MKINRTPIAKGLTLCAALGTFAVAAVSPASAQTPPSPPTITGPHRGGERHPELRRALRTLQRTEADLRHASRDFGGHREKAADLCRQAQSEIQLALQSDRN